MNTGRDLKKFTPTSAVIRAVARVTFSEIIRDKVLYNILICSALLLGVAILASKLSFIRPDRIVLDFGLTGLSLSSGLLAVLVGAGMIGKEFDRRTILVALTKPISRYQFVAGKYVGLLAVVFLNWLFLSVAYLAVLQFLGGQPTGTLAVALLMALIQACVLGALAVFLSSFSTTSLAIILSFGLYLVGTNLSQVRFIATRMQSEGPKAFVNAIATVLPNFEHFNLGLHVTYGLPVSAGFVLTGIFYGFTLVLIGLAGAGALVQKRES